MATVSSLNIKIGADISQLQSAMKQVSSSVQNAGRQMTQLGKTITTRVTAPIAALGTVAVRAFAKQEKAELQLRAALTANGREVDRLFDKYTSFASEMQRITVIGDEATIAMLAQAEALGLTGDSAIRAVKNSAAMQSAFGVNAQSALRYTAALEQGNSTMLARYIPALRDLDDESERVAKAQDILAKAFSAAESEAQSVGGMFEQLKNIMGDAMEDIGESISEAFSLREVVPRVVKKIRQLKEQFTNLSEETRRRIVLITTAIASIGPGLVAVGVTVTAFGALIAALTSPITLVITAIGGITLAFEYVRRNLDVFVRIFKTKFIELKNSVLDSIVAMQQGIAEWAVFLPGITVEATTQAQAAILSLKDPLPEVESEFQSFGEFVMDMGGDILGMFENISGLDFSMPTMEEATDGSNTVSGGGASGTVEKTNRSFKDLLETIRFVNTDFSVFRSQTDQAETSVTEAFQEMKFESQSFGDTVADAFGRAVFQGQNLLDTAKQLLRQFAQRKFISGLAALLSGGSSAGIGGILGSIFSVNDAMITSRGDVVKFHPDDNIIAAKDFSGMGGGGMNPKELRNAFASALQSHTSRLGPDEVWVLNQRGEQLRGRLG